jgi:hypothetical protein
MKLGLKALVIALVMVLAAVPAASAKNGHGGGKPSWAGSGGKPSWAGAGKPSWAGSGHASTKAHHEQKSKKDKAKHHQADANSDTGAQSGGVDLEGLNPAWYCKTLRDEMTQLQSDFASMFGTNPNHANAFGKCVSRRAHGDDLSGAVGGGDPQDQQGSCDTAEPPATDGADSGTDTGADTGTDGSGTETTVSTDGGAPDDGAAQDQGSDDVATEPEPCSDDGSSGSEESAEDEQGQTGDDEQGEDDQGQDEGNASDEGDSSDLAGALRFLRL